MATSNQFKFELYDNGILPFDLPYSIKISNDKQGIFSGLNNKITIIIDISGSMGTEMASSTGYRSSMPPIIQRAMTTTSYMPLSPPSDSPPITPPRMPMSMPISSPSMLRAVTCGGASSSYSSIGCTTRLDIAKEAVIKLINKLVGTSVTLTLITFSDSAKIVYQGLINDSIIPIVSSIHTAGGTNMGSGLELASSISDSDIILLSDGEDTHNTDFTPYQHNITCIGIGKKDNDWDFNTLSILDKYSEPSSAETSSALRNRIMSLSLGLATSFAKSVEISVAGGLFKSSANSCACLDDSCRISILARFIPKHLALLIRSSN